MFDVSMTVNMENASSFIPTPLPERAFAQCNFGVDFDFMLHENHFLALRRRF